MAIMVNYGYTLTLQTVNLLEFESVIHKSRKQIIISINEYMQNQIDIWNNTETTRILIEYSYS